MSEGTGEFSSVPAGGPMPVFPPLARHVAGAVCWGLAMTGCAFASLVLEGRWQTFHLGELMLVYFSGGFGAWLLALPVARLLTRRHGIETRFAGHFALLGLGTVAVTAFVFALDYRVFYARWHQPFGTRIWAYQFAFTIAGAAYQFLVMGLRLYLPAGLPLLAGVSLWLAGRMSRTMR